LPHETALQNQQQHVQGQAELENYVARYAFTLIPATPAACAQARSIWRSISLALSKNPSRVTLSFSAPPQNKLTGPQQLVASSEDQHLDNHHLGDLVD